jgi:hypothetical protein
MRRWMDRGLRGEQRRNAQQVERSCKKRNSDSEGSKDRGLSGFETSTLARDIASSACLVGARMRAVAAS